jgi:cellulose 1,4-beta-cellobiosidase
VRCKGLECGDGSNRYDGICDKEGCDFNPYRMGDRSFYGPGMTIDTTKKMTVVTQFITDNGQDNGKLGEIRRLYVQGGKIIQNTVSKVPGVTETSAISDNFCEEQKTVFGDRKHFLELGGMEQMGASLARVHVLALSVWDDHAVNMLWLDSTFPTDADPEKPSVARSTCPTTSSVPSEVEESAADAVVTYSNIKVGAIGTTYLTTRNKNSGGNNGGGNGATVPRYGQCGDQSWNGATQCESGSTCRAQSQWDSQCL